MDTDFQIQSGLKAKTNIAYSGAGTQRGVVAEQGGKLLPDTQQDSVAEAVAKARVEELQKAEEKSAVEEAARVVSDFLNVKPRGLEFAVNEDAGRTVVTVYDKKDEKVIRQIPSDEVLQLAQKVRELKQELSGKTGMLFESEA